MVHGSEHRMEIQYPEVAVRGKKNVGCNYWFKNREVDMQEGMRRGRQGETEKSPLRDLKKCSSVSVQTDILVKANR